LIRDGLLSGRFISDFFGCDDSVPDFQNAGSQNQDRHHNDKTEIHEDISCAQERGGLPAQVG
jgi:hypothetical protein